MFWIPENSPENISLSDIIVENSLGLDSPLPDIVSTWALVSVLGHLC